MQTQFISCSAVVVLYNMPIILTVLYPFLLPFNLSRPNSLAHGYTLTTPSPPLPLKPSP